jgi:hypothetical protein
MEHLSPMGGKAHAMVAKRRMYGLDLVRDRCSIRAIGEMRESVAALT